MLFSEEWLRSYINPDLTTDELAEKLTMAGLEVEEVTSIAPEFSGVVVGHVLECVDHENSDHLHVCKVDVGAGEVLQIVCAYWLPLTLSSVTSAFSVTLLTI